MYTKQEKKKSKNEEANMETVNGLQVYINSIKNVPLLNAEEEKELTIRYKSGDQRAKDKLVTSNLRLVVMAAKSYKNHTSLYFEDLVQEGNLGLMRAVETFDASKGWRFSTYAMYWIKQSISRAILNNSRTIRIPIHILELKSKYNRAVKELTIANNQEPTSAEIAIFMNMDEKKIKEIETLVKEPLSLSAALNDEDDGILEDLIADPNEDRPDDRIDNELRAKAINTILDTLEEREKEIIVARFGLNKKKAKTLDELSVEFKITKERVRQIEQKALRKMRNPLRLDALRPHLN